MSRPWRRAFSLSGTGNVFDSEQVLPSHADGKLEYLSPIHISEPTRPY